MRGLSERGSSLLSVMVSVIVLFTMLSTLFVWSLQGTQQTTALLQGSKSLMNARTALQEIYQEMHVQWDGDGSSNGAFPDGIWNTVGNQNLSSVENALSQSYVDSGHTSLMYYMQLWMTEHADATWKGSIQLQPNGNNFSTATLSTVYQGYKVIVTGQDGGSTSTLQDIFTISASSGTTSTAVYASNIFITGSPDIHGSIVAANTVFFNQSPWYLESGQTQYTKYHKFSPTLYAEEPSGSEPIVLPYFESGSTIAAKTLQTFTRFNDQTVPTDNTGMFGDAAQVTDGAVVSSISSVATGNPVVMGGSRFSEPNIATIVGTSPNSGVYKTMISQTQAIGTYHTGSFNSGKIAAGTLPVGGGYVNYSNGNDYQYTGSQEIHNPLLFKGTLRLTSGSTLTLNQPLFIDGDLIIQGTMTSSAPIYVTGATRIASNMQENSCLQVYCVGDIDIDVPQAAVPASSETKIYGFFASGSHVYVGGLTSSYVIEGGLMADGSVILNSTVGNLQSVSDVGALQALSSDTTRRLKVAANAWYQSTSPMAASAIVALQSMPQPTLVAA